MTMESMRHCRRRWTASVENKSMTEAPSIFSIDVSRNCSQRTAIVVEPEMRIVFLTSKSISEASNILG